MLEEYPSVSIVIVNYNGKNYLSACLPSIFNSGYPIDKLEIIVVDNGSSDDSVVFLKNNFPTVNILTQNSNIGFAWANNLGAKSAKARYLVFLNNDTVVTKGWLEELILAISGNEGTGVAGSKLIFLDDPQRINSAGGRIVFSGLGYEIGFMEKKEKYSDRYYCGYVSGASLIVRKEEFFNLGMFDEDYFAFGEDVDLCWRYWIAGKKVLYVPASLVYHKYGGTAGGRRTPLRTYLCTKNSLCNMVKNYEIKNIVLYFLPFLVYNFLLFFSFLIETKFAAATAIIKGYFLFCISLPNMLRKRKAIQKTRVIKDKYLFENNLISSFYSSFKELVRLHRIKID